MMLMAITETISMLILILVRQDNDDNGNNYDEYVHIDDNYKTMMI